MHPEVLQWVRAFAEPGPFRVLDLGGRNVNGSPRDLFTGSEYVALDVTAGRGVDIVADAATWQPDSEYDFVVCTEVFEHTPAWRDICRTAFAALKPGGVLIATCAAPGRAVHSAYGAAFLERGEHYENVAADDIAAELLEVGFDDVLAVQTSSFPCDSRLAARKPEGV